MQKQSHSVGNLLSRYIPAYKDGVSRPKSSSHLEENILKKLKELEVKQDEIETHFFLENNRREITTTIPRGRPVEWTVWHLYQCTRGTPYTVTDCVYKKRKKTYTLTYTSDNPKREILVLTFSEAKRFMSNAAKIAILIEDFNFEANQTTIDFLSFPKPLSILLVPSAKKSGWTAQAADEYKKEIIIHLPFEPQDKKSTIPKSSIIMIHYSEEKIRNIIAQAIKTIPNFSGFANLHGHLALEDSRVMHIVCSEIKKHHGYFIDMDAGKNSVVPSIARKTEIPFVEITTVITEKKDISAIEEQLKHCAVVAQKRSKMVIAAKACQPFIKAVNNILPVFKQNGIRLVYVSEIVTHPEKK